MTYHNSKMKDLLAQGLYLLVLQKSFEKITIKQICDKTGVIRGTFYNHFMDKYEALEYLTESLFLESNQVFLEKNDYHLFLKHSLETIEKHKDFFYKAFQIEGQNSFVEMLHNVYKESFLRFFEKKNIDLSQAPLSEEKLISYHMSTLILILKDWVLHGCNLSSEAVLEIIDYYYKNSLYDLMHV